MKKEPPKKNVVIYQTKSGAIELRGDFGKETIWATQAQIVKLFDVDQSVVSRHIRNLFKDGEIEEKSNMQKMHMPAGSATDSKDVVELISLFADTWLSLDAYDKELLPKGKLTKKIVRLTADKITDNLIKLKQSLLEGGQATDIFGRERNEGGVSGIVVNVMQSFGGKELYPTAEEKAAHLLYFMVKNHPFVDGNKRSGAFSFIWFLRQAKILDTAKLTPPALTALTVMVAESRPEHKEKVIKLVLNLLSR